MHGRAEQRAAVDAVLAAARVGTGGALLVEGEPGSGKTCMCEYAYARAGGDTRLQTRGLESEYHVAFSGLAQLLSPIAGKIDRLPAPQRDALSGALALGPTTPTSLLTVGAATLSLLALAAEHRPVLGVVDDVHWLDPASAHAISFAARRLGPDAVALVLAQRADDGHPIDPKGLTSVHLNPLSFEDAVALLAEVSGVLVADKVGRMLVGATAGNPLALIEVSRTLSSGMLAGREALPDPLRVQGQLEETYKARVAGLPAQTRSALLTVASDSSGSLVMLGPALDDWMGIGALEPAEAAGVLVIDALTATFRHPLMRAVVYYDADGTDRRAAHRALASAAARAGDAEREAWHLAAAAIGPDERVAASLERAAQRAAEVGGATASAAAFERSSLLTPPGATRAGRLVAAARALFLAGHPEQVVNYLDEALQQTNDVTVRSEAARLRALVMAAQGDNAGAVAFARAEAEAIAHVDTEQAALVLSEMAVPSTWGGTASEALLLAQDSNALASEVGGVASLLASNHLASLLLFVGEFDEGERLLWDVYASWRTMPPEVSLTTPGPVIGLLYIEEYDRARQMIAASIATARRLGAPAALPFQLAARADVEFNVGDWPSAYAAAHQGVELGEETGQPPLTGWCLALLAMVEGAQGRANDCRKHAARALVLGGAFGARNIYVYGTTALGLLELSLDRPNEARAQLGPLIEWSKDFGWHGMFVKERVYSDLIEATIRAGDDDEAERLLLTFEALAEKSGRLGARAGAARCHALLADDASSGESFEQALRLHRRTTTAFEEARTWLCYGQWLSRTGRRPEAARALLSASGAFEHLGAVPWLERASKELAAVGEKVAPRPASWATDLTPQELAGRDDDPEGTTDEEAAAALFVSPKTIEFHLGNVYRKLGIRSRSQLAHLFARAWHDADAN